MFLIHLSEGDPGWQRWRVPAEGASLRTPNGGAVEIVAGRAPSAAAHVVPFVENERERAALVIGGRVRVFLDGRVPLGVTVLEERAELLVGSERVYFTAREPLAMDRHEGEGDACALCGDSLDGGLVIACTSCGAVTHEGPLPDGRELLCFTHHGRCPRCLLRREDFAWVPEDA